MWEKNSGSGLGHHPTADYVASDHVPEKQAIIAKLCLRSSIIVLWIKNLLTNNDKLRLKAFRIAYTYNNQDDGATMIFCSKNGAP